MTAYERENGIHCSITEEVISPQELFEFTVERGHGAQAFFFGAVRGENHGKKVLSVAYDAAPALASRILRDIAQECLEKWGFDLKVRVIHRVGCLKVGEISVAIGVTSRHRDEAYQASRYIIEEIKVRVPIWKKEIYTDGETEWLKGHALCQHSH